MLVLNKHSFVRLAGCFFMFFMGTEGCCQRETAKCRPVLFYVQSEEGFVSRNQ